MIIDELKSLFAGHESPVAFFYFDYQEQDNRTPSNILSSLLRQIVSTIPEIPKCIVDAYDKLHVSGGSLPLHELERLMLDVTESISRTYIVIDALDECNNPRCRKDFLQIISRLKQSHTIRLLVTSRQYYQDISKFFSADPQIEILAHDSDIRRYMYQELENAAIGDIVDDVFSTKIVETVLNRAQGM
jgi:hypothetical protein